MLAKTLQQMIDQKLTTAREIGDLAGVSPSTVYRWIARQSQPDFDAIRLLLRHLPSRHAQEALLGAFISGTDWHCTHTELELDINDDGKVDADDALDASIQAVQSTGQSLTQIRRAGRGHALTPEETLELIAQLNHVVRHCAITQRVLIEMAEHRKNRKLKLAE